jgi:hypothetical protein
MRFPDKIFTLFFASLTSCLFLLSGAACVAQSLILAGSDKPLVFAGAGQKTLHISIAETSSSSGSAGLKLKLKLELRAYAPQAEVDPQVLATTEVPIPALFATAATTAAAAPGSVTAAKPKDAKHQNIESAITLPALGLYEVTATLVGKDGTLVEQKKVNIATVPPRTETGPADFGVCTHFANIRNHERDPGMMPAVLALVKLAGFSRIRDEMTWSGVERIAGKFEFPAHMDAWIERARALGLSPLVVLDYANARAHPEAFGAKRDFPSTPEAAALYARYAAECVKRYGHIVKQWEIWNEPHTFGKATLDEYARLLIAAYPAIKKADRTAHVISCGGGGAGGGPGGDYVLGVIKRGGLDYMDGFSIHPYMSPSSPDRGYPARTSPISGKRVSIPTVWPHLQRYIDRHIKADGAPLSLWVTEIGWFSTANLPFIKSHPVQAAHFVRTYLLARRHRTAQAVFWYDFRNDGFSDTNREHNFGLVTNDFQPKPAYVAAAVLTSTLGNRPWTKSLIEDDFVKVFQYGEGDDAIYAGWCSGLDTEKPLVKFPPGTWIQRDWQGRETEITVTDKGIDWRISPLPSWLIRKK